MLQQMQPILEIIFQTNYDFGYASRKIAIKWVDISEVGSVHHSEAGIAAHEQGECVSGRPGSQTIAGHSTVRSGTRESHNVPKEASNESKRRRRKYGDMAVGLTHSRGVNGVMLIEPQEPGTLEGISSKAQRDE